MFAQDLLAVLPEQIVHVPQSRERVRRDVFDQLEDRDRDIIPCRAEKYHRVRGLEIDVLTARIAALAFCKPAYISRLQEVVIGVSQNVASAGIIESAVVVVERGYGTCENMKGEHTLRDKYLLQ